MTTTIVRRHNPYLALSCSFDGSLSTSLDKCVHPQPRHAPPPAAAASGEVTPSGHTTNESSAQVSAIGSSDGYDTTGDFDVQSVSSATAPQTPTTHPTKGSRRRSAFSFNATDMTALLGHYDAPVDLPCPGGSIVKAYNGDISQHFNIPSECVLITRGSIKYADHLERFGVQMRFRFQLCHNFLRHSCPRKSECSYIHATSLPSPSEVHLNPLTPRRFRRGGCTNAAADQQDAPLAAQDDPRVADSYETLPPGMTLSVYPPNDKGTMEPQKIPSELILVTAGSVSAKRGADAHVRHCAHYQFRRLCHQGTRCNFIHSKVPFAQHPALCKASPSPSPDGCPSP